MPMWRTIAAGLTIAFAATSCGAGVTTDPSADEASIVIAEYLDPDTFSDPTTIDNEWWPLVPGTEFTWQGHAFEEGERLERRVVFTVTDLIKTIAGIDTLVGWERDFNDGELEESELIFLAQDDDGTVWHFGQYVEILEDDGAFLGSSAWLAGYLDGARPGIMMPADPAVGAPEYEQGFAPAPFDWDDRAKVEAMGERICVPRDCYDDTLAIREWERGKPGAWQLKYHARGVGMIRVGWDGAKEQEKEILELTDVVTLSDEAVHAVRETALQMEARAYVYGATQPSRPRA